MNKTAYLLLRLAIGISMLGHGLVRLPKLPTFSHWMVGNFQKSFLPAALVTPFSYLLPVSEFLIGLLLTLGLFTKQASIAGGIVLILLIFGTTTIENWDAIPVQLIHVAFFATLIHFTDSNSFALDRLFSNKNNTPSY